MEKMFLSISSTNTSILGVVKMAQFLSPQYNYKVKTTYECKDNGSSIILALMFVSIYKGIPFDDIDFDTDDDKITQNGIDRFSIRNILELTTLRTKQNY